MYKHVAAALYGVGARFDEDPSLFLRCAASTMDDIITQTVADTTQTLLRKAERQRANVLDEVDLGEVFGIRIDDLHASPGPACVQPKPSTRTKHAAHTQKTHASKTRAPVAQQRAAPRQHAPAQRGGRQRPQRGLSLCRLGPQGRCWRRWSTRWEHAPKANPSSTVRAGWDGRTYSSATPSVGQAPKGSLNWSLPASIGRKFEVTVLTSGRRHHVAWETYEAAGITGDDPSRRAAVGMGGTPRSIIPKPRDIFSRNCSTVSCRTRRLALVSEFSDPH